MEEWEKVIAKENEEWQNRVKAEKKELDIKIKDLYIFLDESEGTEPMVEIMLVKQYDIMIEYSILLGARIQTFGT